MNTTRFLIEFILGVAFQSAGYYLMNFGVYPESPALVHIIAVSFLLVGLLFILDSYFYRLIHSIMTTENPITDRLCVLNETIESTAKTSLLFSPTNSSQSNTGGIDVVDNSSKNISLQCLSDISIGDVTLKECSENLMETVYGNWVVLEAGSGSMIPSHFHESSQLIFVVSGSINVNLEKETHLIMAGEKITIDPNIIHSLNILDDSILISCTI